MGRSSFSKLQVAWNRSRTFMVVHPVCFRSRCRGPNRQRLSGCQIEGNRYPSCLCVFVVKMPASSREKEPHHKGMKTKIQRHKEQLRKGTKKGHGIVRAPRPLSGL